MTSFRCELPSDVVTDWIKVFGFKNLRDKRSLPFPATNPVTKEQFDQIASYYYPSRMPTVYDYETCKKILRQILKKSGYLLMAKEIRVKQARIYEYYLTTEEMQDAPTQTWPLGVDPLIIEGTTHS